MIWTYYELKGRKLNFLTQRKVIKLQDEHNNILNKLPDGVMIHKTTSDIRKQQNKMALTNNRRS